MLSVFRSEKDLKLPIVKLKSMILEKFPQRCDLFLKVLFFLRNFLNFLFFSPRTFVLTRVRRLGELVGST